MAFFCHAGVASNGIFVDSSDSISSSSSSSISSSSSSFVSELSDRDTLGDLMLALVQSQPCEGVSEQPSSCSLGNGSALVNSSFDVQSRMSVRHSALGNSSSSSVRCEFGSGSSQKPKAKAGSVRGKSFASRSVVAHVSE